MSDYQYSKKLMAQLTRSISAKLPPNILNGGSLTDALVRIIPYALLGNRSELGAKLVTTVSSLAGRSLGQWLSKLIGGGLLGGVAGVVLGGWATNVLGGWLSRVFGVKKRKSPTLNLPLSTIVERTPHAERYTLEPRWGKVAAGAAAPVINIQVSGIVGNEFEVTERLAEQLAQHLKLRQLTAGERLGGV